VIGTFLNVASILIGGALGMLLGSRLPEKLKSSVVAGLGLFTLAYGLRVFVDSNNVLVVLGSILIGVLLGEWLQIEEGLRRLGAWLEQRALRATTATGDGSGENRFVRGFLTASLVFCVGPLSILGAIQDGLSGDFSILAVKSTLDVFGSLAFASSLGVGVLFSAAVILVYQGSITLLAAQMQNFVSADMMTEMTATGGVILIGLAISSLLEIKPIRMGNFLPALIIAPLLTALFVALRLY